jgi:hypothetical protein
MEGEGGGGEGRRGWGEGMGGRARKEWGEEGMGGGGGGNEFRGVKVQMWGE